MIHLDTSYVVDLLRERRCGEVGPATLLLQELENEELALSVLVLCELRAGAEQARNPVSEHESVDLIEARIAVAPIGVETAQEYGRALAHLKRGGNVVASMDLLIAAVCLAAGASLVTRNRRHFERVPGLRLVEY